MNTQEESKSKLLVVDDEPDIREILQVNLEAAGYEVITASSAEEALALLDGSVSLILLDVMLGGISGFSMVRKLRKELNNPVPVIFLTAKDTENDLLTGFSAGGDDYISKPFSIHEVLARVGAVLRRRTVLSAGEDSSIKIGGIEIIPDRKLVRSNGVDVMLTPKEYGILNLGAPGAQIVNRQGYGYCFVEK